MLVADASIIMRKMRVYAERRLASWDVGFPEQQVLMILRTQGPSNQEALATELQIDKGSIAKTVSKLEGKGLVSRAVSAKSRREKLVSLEPAADAVLEDMWAAYQELENVMYEGLSPGEVEQTGACLSRIAGNLAKALRE